MKARVTEDLKFLHLYEYNEKEIQQIKYSFNKRISNWRFHPLVKKRVWDGYIAFIDKYNRIPIGLWSELNQVCKKFELELSIDGFDEIIDNNINETEFVECVRDFFKDHPLYCVDGKKEIRDYQITAAYLIIRYRLSTSEIATSAGKTLIMFIIFSYLIKNSLAKRFMIVVPNTSLILQTMENFEEYNNDKIDFKMQPIHGGTEKIKNNYECIIGTFQSLTKMENDWFSGVDVVCVDEAHTTNSVSVKNIISKSKDAKYRFGISGTIKQQEASADSFTIQAYLGPYINDISAKFLIDNNYATRVYVKVVKMNYLDIETKTKLQEIRNRKSEFEGSQILDIEKKIVIENRRRFLYVCDFVSKTSKNSLVLFSDIKYGYGRSIYDWLRQNTDKEVFYVDGGTDINTRAEYFDRMDKNENIILCASFGTLSTGVSINNIHNIFLTESYKSDKIIRQSIGRGMRKMNNKNFVTIIDFVDDFSLHSKNYLLAHGEERVKTYTTQQFPYKIYNVSF
jgi:superfamily II DNA or RNA helicase